MRKIINLQMEFWKKDISQIKFDLKSRDEIPKLLLGLQHIYSTPAIRKQIFNILKVNSRRTGRPGMDLWKILVLGTLRLNCKWDYDKVQEMANSHNTTRQMIGHSETDFHSKYALQTIKDNISLFTPQILDEINQIVVNAGHNIIEPKIEPKLNGSCDSFVVETDVHYPTDTNLLFDATRKTISLIAIICSEIGITAWRQSHHNILKVKRLLRVIQKMKLSKLKNPAKRKEREKLIICEHQKYIDLCWGFIFQAKETIRTLRELKLLSPSQNLRMKTIEEYIHHADRQIDQIIRRVVYDHKIPHKEKVFSLFEPHTEWISKGKAGVPQELGLKVCVLKDQYGFLLHHQVMKQQTDDEVAVSMVQETLKKFKNLSGCSFDKGFYKPENRKKLEGLLNCVILPKKGRLSDKDKRIEHSEEFIKYRHKHSAVESTINALENHGLDRCCDHGLHGFERYVGLAVLARNIQIIGHLIQQKKLAREKRCMAA